MRCQVSGSLRTSSDRPPSAIIPGIARATILFSPSTELWERAQLLETVERLEADVDSGDIEEFRERVALLSKLAGA